MLRQLLGLLLGDVSGLFFSFFETLSLPSTGLSQLRQLSPEKLREAQEIAEALNRKVAETQQMQEHLQQGLMETWQRNEQLKQQLDETWQMNEQVKQQLEETNLMQKQLHRNILETYVMNDDLQEKMGFPRNGFPGDNLQYHTDVFMD